MQGLPLGGGYFGEYAAAIAGGATTAFRDLAARLRVLAAGTRDAATRLRLQAAGARDAAGRLALWASSARDVAARLVVRTVAYRDASVRFGVITPGTFRDGALRVVLRATAYRDAPGRFRAAVAGARDVALRLVVRAPANRDAAGRLRAQATGNRDARQVVQREALAYAALLRAHIQKENEVLFVLGDLLDSREARAGDVGVLAAMGPGFSAELVLLRW